MRGPTTRRRLARELRRRWSRSSWRVSRLPLRSMHWCRAHPRPHPTLWLPSARFPQIRHHPPLTGSLPHRRRYSHLQGVHSFSASDRPVPGTAAAPSTTCFRSCCVFVSSMSARGIRGMARAVCATRVSRDSHCMRAAGLLRHKANASRPPLPLLRRCASTVAVAAPSSSDSSRMLDQLRALRSAAAFAAAAGTPHPRFAALSTSVTGIKMLASVFSVATVAASAARPYYHMTQLCPCRRLCHGMAPHWHRVGVVGGHHRRLRQLRRRASARQTCPIHSRHLGRCRPTGACTKAKRLLTAGPPRAVVRKETVFVETWGTKREHGGSLI